MSEAKSNRITPSCSQETSVSYVPTVIESLKSDYRLLMRIKHTLFKKKSSSYGVKTYLCIKELRNRMITVFWSVQQVPFLSCSNGIKHDHAWSLHQLKVHNLINLILFFSIYSKTTR